MPGLLLAVQAYVHAHSPHPAPIALAPRLLVVKGTLQVFEATRCCCMADNGGLQTVEQAVAPAAESCVAAGRKQTPLDVY
jgi:hypothetical protein